MDFQYEFLGITSNNNINLIQELIHVKIESIQDSFIPGIHCINSDYEMIMVTSTISLYPNLHPPQVFGEQETNLLYPSSTSSLKLSMSVSLFFQQPRVVNTLLMLFAKLSPSYVSFRYSIPFSSHNPKVTGDGKRHF